MRKDIELKSAPVSVEEYIRVKVKQYQPKDYFVSLSDSNKLYVEQFNSGKLLKVASLQLDAVPLDFNLDSQLRLIVLFHDSCQIYELQKKVYTHLQTIVSSSEMFESMSQPLMNSIVISEGPKFSLYALRHGSYSFVRSDITTDQTNIYSICLYISGSLKIALSTSTHIHIHDHRSGVLITSLRIPSKAISIMPNPAASSVIGVLLTSGHVIAYDTRYPHSPIFSFLVAVHCGFVSSYWLPGQPDTITVTTSLGECLLYQPEGLVSRLLFSTEQQLPLLSFDSFDNNNIPVSLLDVFPVLKNHCIVFSSKSTTVSIVKFKEQFYYDMTPCLPREMEIYHQTDFELPANRNQSLFNRLKSSLWDDDAYQGPSYVDYFDLNNNSTCEFNDMARYIQKMKAETLPVPTADSAHSLYRSFARALYRKDINMACKIILQRLHHLANISTSLSLSLIEYILNFDADNANLAGQPELLHYAALLGDAESEIEIASDELRTKVYCAYYSLQIIEDIKKNASMDQIQESMTKLGDLLVKCPIAVEENLFTELVSLLTPALDKPFTNFLYKLAPVTPQNRLSIVGSASAPVLLPSIYMDMPSDVAESILVSFKKLLDLSDETPSHPDLTVLRKFIPKTYGFVGKKSQEIALVEHDIFSSHFLQLQLKELNYFYQHPKSYKLDASHISLCIIPLLSSLYNYISSDAFGHTGTIIRAHVEMIDNPQSGVSKLLTDILQEVAWPRYLKLVKIISKSQNINLLTNIIYQFSAFTRSSTQSIMIPQSVFSELNVVIPILIKNLLNLPNPESNYNAISELYSAMSRLRTKRIGAKNVEAVLSNLEVTIEEWLDARD